MGRGYWHFVWRIVFWWKWPICYIFKNEVSFIWSQLSQIPVIFIVECCDQFISRVTNCFHGRLFTVLSQSPNYCSVMGDAFLCVHVSCNLEKYDLLITMARYTNCANIAIENYKLFVLSKLCFSLMYVFFVDWAAHHPCHFQIPNLMIKLVSVYLFAVYTCG